jgi:hypothetical protein
MMPDKVTPETPQEKAEFWERKCKEAERELLISYKIQDELRTNNAHLCGCLEDLRKQLLVVPENTKETEK